MKAFAALIDALVYQPQRNLKLRLLSDYLACAPDPDRGYALAALTGDLDFPHAKPALIRGLVAERCDPVLFDLSYDYVGDLAETVALIWPKKHGANTALSLGEVVEVLRETGKAGLPAALERMLDALEPAERFALLKLITGAMRVGVSARLAKTAVAALGILDVNAIEEVWPGLSPPYETLFAWAAGTGPRPEGARALFRPVMLAHPLEEKDLAEFPPTDYLAEWKWDGIRVQAVSDGGTQRLYSRTGEDIGAAFPDVLSALPEDAVIDGELLILRDGEADSFNALQQRLNRKSVSAKMLAAAPAGIRAYDLLFRDGEDMREHPFERRRGALEGLIAARGSPRLDLSPLVPFATWQELAAHRASPPSPAIEGVMLKRRDSSYMPGRVTGLWWKWKRDPHLIDAVLMYAQRGHGKRSSFYSDYTFGVWQGEALVPVGKAYFGFTDAELKQIDKFVRDNTVETFGPVRVVAHQDGAGLVFEVAFEGLARSARHKSGVAMRFPRINRIRFDKPAREADTLEALQRLLP
ncbi:MAG: cisplatin damage response ATP-dependent DNA ligase [Alphaproteobacteria bacterium]|nr:cisplatin damage response ATP-dependent DNA ligase [Alphaproteobacteria bacterium]